MKDYEFNVVYGEVHVAADALSWRSVVLSLRSNDDLGAQLFFENSDDHFTYEALDGKMVDGRHHVMDKISYYQDKVSLIETSLLKEYNFHAKHHSPLLGPHRSN